MVKLMAKLWQGVFEGAKEDVIAFNSLDNIKFDEKLTYYDILGSIAHIKMLSKQNILKQDEAVQIIDTLKQIFQDYKVNKFKLDPELEDIHTNIENAVTKITPFGKKMHMARSRNDQVLLDMRLYLRDHVLEICEQLFNLQSSFASLSKKEGVMASYTHTRVAQPITVSFWCDSFVKSFERDFSRLLDCYKRININPLGACAIAGTSWNIDREYTAKLLGFSTVQKNALDTITSRGECEAELVFVLSMLLTKLSGLSEELIWLSQKGLIKIPDEFCTGSSIMPNKKNPDVLELVRARSAKVSSHLFQILNIKKGLISGYHSDMQETKGTVMQAIEITNGCISVLASLIQKLVFDQTKIIQELESGYAQATWIADALVKKGAPFRDTHGIVGKLVNDCQSKEIYLSQAEPLEGFTKDEWLEITSLERERLKVEIKLDENQIKEVEEKIKEIEKCFDGILA